MMSAVNELGDPRRGEVVDEEEKELKWAALERLPMYKRVRKGLLMQVLDDGKVFHKEIDLQKLGNQHRKTLVDSILNVVEDDHHKFLKRIRDRFDKVSLEIPAVEVRYENVSVDGRVYVGSRALPTLLNSTLNVLETILGTVRLIPSKKQKIKILDDISGIIRPSRMTLLLGPPRSGKTTLLKALAGRMDKDLKMTGKIRYNGHELHEFIPQKTSIYVGQNDHHYGELTVRETIDFSGQCFGVGMRYELLQELLRREKQAGIVPDWDIDAFMKATAMPGQQNSLLTDYVLKLLGLDICANTIVGDEMRRGISGGEKKRVTTGEMLVGPAKVFIMDEISTGLDSSTTYQICRYLRDMVHVMDATMIVSLLQPTPETYNLFDDIVLLSEGQIIYQGPCEHVLEFFESMGLRCPERKGVADFLQEVTSKKDQEKYWFLDQPYRYISVFQFTRAFKSFHAGRKLASDLFTRCDKSNTQPTAIVKEKYGISNRELLKACFSREWILMKRNYFLYIFKTTQITIMSLITMTVFFRTTMHHNSITDGAKYLGALYFSLLNLMFNGSAELAMTVISLPVFHKQRDFLFYPAWAYGLPICVLRLPLSILESALWVILTYYCVGYAPTITRFLCQWLAFFCTHLMALSLFRFLGAAGRTMIIANSIGTFVLLAILLLSGFIIAKNDIGSWMKWAYYLSPLMYGTNAIVINEFLDDRWSIPIADPRMHNQTIGRVLLSLRGLFEHQYWYWISVGALLGFSFLFNILYVLALTYLNPFGDSKTAVLDDDETQKNEKNPLDRKFNDTALATHSVSSTSNGLKRGMVLPFKPLSLTFHHVNYYVDMPAEMKNQGCKDDRLQLLRDVSGAFRPGVLTALVGVSGAGKTTLLDVLAGRKTVGYIEGRISISGYPKNQTTFARISGYCEQTDTHSPYVTVYESLVYSAFLRLSSNVDTKTQKMFVEEVIELVELKPLKNTLVGLPGVNGLSTEQRKRLTIAVELVANPSIIFMDEPTSGLDARAAAIVMRTVRNTVDTGRTVVCTIHQPSIDIFESFDELILMKRGGQIIYEGPIGQNSRELIEYFEAIPRVPKIKDGYNPATWVLDISSLQAESQLNLDFAEHYTNSLLYQRNEELIKELSTPAPDSSDLYFATKYSQRFFAQYKACFWKQYKSYWRNPQYNATRFAMTALVGVLFGVLYWNKGGKISKQQDLLNLLGAMYMGVLFLGSINTYSVQAVVAIERTVFYREKAAGMYSSLPYAFAQVTIEAIYNVIQTLLYTLILYSMIGFEWNLGKFLYFYYFMLTCFLYFTMYGMMLVALTPNPHISAILMTFFLNFWNLFAGFLIPRQQIPIWWRWYYWASPVAWTLYGLMTSQLGDNKSVVVIPGATRNLSVKDFLQNYFGYDYDFLPIVVAAHIGWVLLFIIVFAYGIKYLNFQKR